jgi:phosphatidate cytidylyltransferase
VLTFSVNTLVRTRLSSISPKKTVEGAVFGIAGSIVVAITGAWYLDWPSWQLSGVIFGTLVGIASLLGDLTESLMKRDAGVRFRAVNSWSWWYLRPHRQLYFYCPVGYYFLTLLLPLLPPFL